MFLEQFHPREPRKGQALRVSIAGFFRFIHYFLHPPACVERPEDPGRSSCARAELKKHLESTSLLDGVAPSRDDIIRSIVAASTLTSADG